MKRRVIVNLKTDKAIGGVLWRRTPTMVILKQARLLENGSEMPIDGEVFLDRSNIDFVQVVNQ